MAIPDYQTLMLPVLRLAAKGEQRVADVADRVANEFGLGAEEKETLLPSGRQRVLNNRIHWAKFYMSKAGLISSPARGRFVATEEGHKLLATNPDQINVTLLMKWPSFREFYRTSPDLARIRRRRWRLVQLIARLWSASGRGLVVRLRPLESGTARRSRDPQYPALYACHSALWRGQDGLQEPGQCCVVVSA